MPSAGNQELIAPQRVMTEINPGKTRQNGAEPLESAHCARRRLCKACMSTGFGIAPSSATGYRPAWPTPGPMLLSGFLMPAIWLRAGRSLHASVLSSPLIRCNTSASPFSPQYKAIICASASTLKTSAGNAANCSSNRASSQGSRQRLSQIPGSLCQYVQQDG